MSYTRPLNHIVFRTKNSKKWLSANPDFPGFEWWAVSFEEEYRKILIKKGIDIDERYFLKD